MRFAQLTAMNSDADIQNPCAAGSKGPYEPFVKAEREYTDLVIPIMKMFEYMLCDDYNGDGYEKMAVHDDKGTIVAIIDARTQIERVPYMRTIEAHVIDVLGNGERVHACTGAAKEAITLCATTTANEAYKIYKPHLN